MSLDRHVNFICKQIYCNATSGIVLMMSSAHCSSHIVPIGIIVCYGFIFNSTKSSLIKLYPQAIIVLLRLFCITKRSKLYSDSNMFVSRGISSFAELLRKSIYRFKNLIELLSNFIIHYSMFIAIDIILFFIPYS